ncbi:MAG: acyl-CoA dehydrogenase family protein [Ignavibacteria bacterium]|nr:acyl-CoA dehydrogenase family protein [Ignavibacteria bacterium]
MSHTNEPGAYSFALDEHQILVRDTARDFAESEIRPHVMEWDEAQHFPRDLFTKMGELGFLGIMFPEELEGAGMSAIEYALIVEEISRVDPSIGLGVAAHNGLCSNHLYQFASPVVRQKYMPDLASGRKLGMWGLTEPGSGSDAGGMRTTAVLDGDAWVLNGSKNFITHATYGETAVVMAVTEPGQGSKGISAFVLERTMPGFSTGKKENKLGMRASDTATIIMENVRVPKENLLGGETGNGFKQALQILDGGRVSIAACSVGTAQGAYETALAYSKERKQFGKPLAEFQATQFKLAKMAMDIEAARLLTHKAAWMRTQGMDINVAASYAKLFASEVATRVTNEAVQILGGYGFTKDYAAEKYYRDVKLLTIGEGTSEIQRLVISRRLLQD